MHAQQQPCALSDCFLVVGDASAIRRANFAQLRARLGHHVRNAERSTDLDQLTARDYDLAALRQSVEREKDGRSIVVDDYGGDVWPVCRQELAEQPIDMNVALAAFAGRNIKLQVGILRGCLADVAYCCFPKR